jgi:hypothetical protein
MPPQVHWPLVTLHVPLAPLSLQRASLPAQPQSIA